MNIHIAKSGPLLKSRKSAGQRCIDWARANRTETISFTDDISQADVIFSVFYSEKIDLNLLKPACKAFNFHAGILPQYRGSGTINFAIINREDETGITLHEIDKNIDTGDIISIEKFPISSEDTAETLMIAAEDTAVSMFIRCFDNLIKGQYESFQQSEAASATYTRRDLQQAKDLTHYAKAFHLPGKEQAFYFDRNGKKHFLKW